MNKTPEMNLTLHAAKSGFDEQNSFAGNSFFFLLTLFLNLLFFALIAASIDIRSKKEEPEIPLKINLADTAKVQTQEVPELPAEKKLEESPPKKKPLEEKPQSKSEEEKEIVYKEAIPQETGKLDPKNFINKKLNDKLLSNTLLEETSIERDSLTALSEKKEDTFSSEKLSSDSEDEVRKDFESQPATNETEDDLNLRDDTPEKQQSEDILALNTTSSEVKLIREKQESSSKQTEFENPEDFIPDEIRPTLRGSKPEKSNHEGLNFTLDDYSWNFETYISSWANDLIKWWRAPSDYISGKVPQGGSVWVRVKISNEGELIEYKIYDSNVTNEMQLKVVQTLISSFDRDQLPESFSGKEITVNWQFIYRPIGKSFEAKK